MSIPSYPLGQDALRVHSLHEYLKRAAHASRSSHRHGFWQFIAFEGEGVHFVDLEEYDYRRGSILVLPEGAVHRFSDGDTNGTLLHVPESYFNRCEQDATRLLNLRARALEMPFFVAEGAHGERVATILTWLREEARAEIGDSELQHALLQTLVLLLLRSAQRQAPQRSDYLRFLELVEERYKTRPSVSEITRTLQMSAKRLYALTNEAVGLPPARIIENRLLLEAKRRLVHSEEAVSSIAFDLGFSDPAYFSRFFKRQVGQSPRGFRSTQQP